MYKNPMKCGDYEFGYDSQLKAIFITDWEKGVIEVPMSEIGPLIDCLIHYRNEIDKHSFDSDRLRDGDKVLLVRHGLPDKTIRVNRIINSVIETSDGCSYHRDTGWNDGHSRRIFLLSNEPISDAAE